MLAHDTFFVYVISSLTVMVLEVRQAVRSIVKVVSTPRLQYTGALAMS